MKQERMMNEHETVICKGKSLFGLLVYKGCGWTGTRQELEMVEFCTDPQSWHMLAGREGFKLLCPNCGAELDEIITRMS